MSTNTKKPILVTGSHRSGSTWVGQVLSAAPGVAYIHEPFNVANEIGFNRKEFSVWFQYVCDKNESYFYDAIKDTLSYKYPLVDNLVRTRTPKHAVKIVRDQSRTIWRKAIGARPLIKDPIAVFSVEWLAETFDVDVLVLIRHPAAFCSSAKVKNWQFDFNEFVRQPLLMEKYLYPFEKQILDFSRQRKGVIEQAALLWNCVHHTINIYRDGHPDWLFITHESISTDPRNEFSAIFDAFDLRFTKAVERKIADTTGAHNPIEQTKKNEFRRNSQANIQNWKKRLTPSEIQCVRSITSSVSDTFYDYESWI